MPILNPMESCSHGAKNKRTFSIFEPLWAYRLRQSLFCFGGRHRCPDRGKYSTVHNIRGQNKPFPDTWNLGGDGNRTCSFCGSIHPHDLIAICRKSLEDERYGVEGTTKSYKVYVRQPGVRNASEGAIKFYMSHAPSNPSAKDQKLFSDALRLSHDRFEKQLDQMRKRNG